MSIDASEDAKTFTAKRIARRATFEIDARPRVIFPLLCPVREREWLEGWKADVVYSESRLAENNGVFATENKLFGAAIYVVSRYDPDQGLMEYVVFFPGKCIQKLDLALTPKAGGRTSVALSRVYTGLSPEGNDLLDRITEAAFNKQTEGIAQSLARYCKHLGR